MSLLSFLYIAVSKRQQERCGINNKQTDKQVIIRNVAEGIYTIKKAAFMLNLTTQRVRQLLDAFIIGGESTLIHGNSGKQPAIYRFNEELKTKIVSLKNSQIYNKTNFSNFKKLLNENEGIEIGYTTLVNILNEAGITSPMKHRMKRKGFRWRKRREHFGELLQISATLHDWFKDSTSSVLHIIIDDATGCITGFYFCKNECLDGYLAVLRQTLTDYGIPMGIYSTMLGLFYKEEKNKNSHSEKMTQTKTDFGKLVEDKLGIELSDIDPSQAMKCHETLCNKLHDHLSSWLLSQGITKIEQANKEMHRYINVFNSTFSVRAKSNESLFEPLGIGFII